MSTEMKTQRVPDAHSQHTVYTRHDSRTLHKSASTVTGSMRERRNDRQRDKPALMQFIMQLHAQERPHSVFLQRGDLQRSDVILQTHNAAQHPCKPSDTSLQLLHSTRWCKSEVCVRALRCTGSDYTYMRSDGICSQCVFHAQRRRFSPTGVLEATQPMLQVKMWQNTNHGLI